MDHETPDTDAGPIPMPPPSLLGRYRQLRDNARLRHALMIRCRAVAAIRRVLQEQGFVEIDTPLLHRDHTTCGPLPVGARAAGERLNLRTHSLHLRGLLAAGYSSVFEVARMFRDEPADADHQPEYSLIEVYQAGSDYQQMLSLAQHLLVTAATAALGTAVVTTRAGTAVNLANPWPARAFYDSLTAATGTRLDPDSTSDQLQAAAHPHGITLTAAAPVDQALELHDRLVQPATASLTVFRDFPAAPSPMARPNNDDRRLAQKWDLVIAASEIATAYTEQHDQCPQPNRPQSGAPETQLLTEQWRQVFTGMPPAGGLCIGLDRLIMLLAGAATLADVIAFPLEPR